MRMENKVKQYLNIELDNPIKKGGTAWHTLIQIYRRLNITQKYFKQFSK